MGLVIIYPLMKRVTNWPQFVLGLTFNWSACYHPRRSFWLHWYEILTMVIPGEPS